MHLWNYGNIIPKIYFRNACFLEMLFKKSLDCKDGIFEFILFVLLHSTFHYTRKRHQNLQLQLPTCSSGIEQAIPLTKGLREVIVSSTLFLNLMQNENELGMHLGFLNQSCPTMQPSSNSSIAQNVTSNRGSQLNQVKPYFLTMRVDVRARDPFVDPFLVVAHPQP